MKFLIKILFGATALLGAGSLSALELEISLNNSTTSDDHNRGDAAASSAIALTTATQIIADEVGNSATVEGRAYGYVASKSYNGWITQTVSITATYTVTADEGVEYNITFNPNFHGMFNISDDQSATGNSVTLSSLTGRINGSTVSALGMSNASKSTNGSTNYDASRSYTLSSQTTNGGTTTYTLKYTFEITADSKDATGSSFGNPTGITTNDAFLWGMSGSLSGASVDEYTSSSTRLADGLFLPATVTITSVTAVPEPSTYAIFGGLALLTVLIGRRRK